MFLVSGWERRGPLREAMAGQDEVDFTRRRVRTGVKPAVRVGPAGSNRPATVHPEGRRFGRAGFSPHRLTRELRLHAERGPAASPARIAARVA